MENKNENCPNCGAPCTVSFLGYSYIEVENASAPALLKENQELKARIEELEIEIKVLQQFDER